MSRRACAAAIATCRKKINRIVTDRLADLLLTPSRDGDDNLLRRRRAAGADPPRRQHHDRHADAASAVAPPGSHSRSRAASSRAQYAVLTLHRPSNVDDPDTLRDDSRSAPRRLPRDDAGRVPGAPANPRAHRGVRSRPVAGRLVADRAAGLHRLPEPHVATRARSSRTPAGCRKSRRRSAFRA